MNWIACSERMPAPERVKVGKQHEIVADFVPCLFVLSAEFERRVCAGRYFPDSTTLAWESLQGSEYERDEVTHWMPIPDPPNSPLPGGTS